MLITCLFGLGSLVPRDRNNDCGGCCWGQRHSHPYLFFVAVAVRQPEDLYESVYVGCFHHLPSKPLFV